jgi:hypothetical protein
MAAKNLVIFGDIAGTVTADTVNNPSTVVMRDTDGTVNRERRPGQRHEGRQRRN